VEIQSTNYHTVHGQYVCGIFAGHLCDILCELLLDGDLTSIISPGPIHEENVLLDVVSFFKMRTFSPGTKVFFTTTQIVSAHVSLLCILGVLTGIFLSFIEMVPQFYKVA